MLNRQPLAANSGESPVETSEAEITPASPAAPATAPQDALAGAFPAWDLLPPDAFVKRVTRKKAGETPTL